MFVDIASLHHVVVGGDVVDLVRVSRHEMDFVAVQRREQRLGVGRVVVEGEARARGLVYLRMHGHDQRRRLVDVRQILGEPVQLFVGEFLDVVARVGSVVCAAIDIVHDDVVHLTDVERVEGRADAVHVLDGRVVVGRGHEVVVVVAHGVVDLQVLDLAVDRLPVLGQRIVVFVPVEVPRHVAQREGVHLLAAVLGHVGVQIGGELGELGGVVGAVGQVHVAQQEELVAILSVDLREFEVLLFHDVGCSFQRLVELREHALGRYFVAAGDGDEDIAPLLGRFEFVDALVVGDGHFGAVGYHDVRDGTFLRRYQTEDRGAGTRFKVDLVDDVDVDFADLFLACVPFEVGCVGTGFALVG